jgi:peptide/nickel transport system substrate-binding protein
MFAVKRLLHPGVVLLLAAALTAGCSSSGGGDSGNSGASQDLTVGWQSPPDVLNPATTGARSVGPLVATMFDTLVWLTPDMKVTPDLASKWTISDDGLKYDFTLKENVKFHDGTPFNAQAVVDNINYINDKETQSKISLGLLGSCLTAKAESEFVVSLTCSSPYAPLLAQLGEPYLGIQSPTAIKKYGKDVGQHPTGTGPFSFVSYTPNQSLVVKNNPDYQWAPEAAGHNGQAKMGQITFNFIPNDQSRVGALQSNQAQLIQGTPGVFYKQLKDRYGQSPNPISGLGIFAPINAGTWPTSELDVRQAIMYAIDRKSLIEFASAGVFPPNDVPLTNGMLGYDQSLSGMYPYDPAKAEAVLTEGGWTRGADGWTKDGKKLTLKITAISTSPTYPLLAQAMQGNLQKVGIDATVEQMGAAAWTDANVKGDFNLTPLTYVAVDPDALSFWFKPGSYYNWSHYTNDELSGLLEKGKVTTDADERTKTYQAAQKIIMDQAVLMPIHESQDLLTYSKKLSGLSYSGGGFESFYGVTLTS